MVDLPLLRSEDRILEKPCKVTNICDGLEVDMFFTSIRSGASNRLLSFVNSRTLKHSITTTCARVAGACSPAQVSVRSTTATAEALHMGSSKQKVWIDCDAGLDDAQGKLFHHAYTQPCMHCDVDPHILHDRNDGNTCHFEVCNMHLKFAGLMVALTSDTCDVVGISLVFGNVVNFCTACPISKCAIAKKAQE